MGPLLHLQVGALAANARPYDLRERRLVMLSALAPDLDGVFFWNAELWERMHHTVSHNVYFAAAVAAVFAVYNRKRRTEMLIVCFLTAIAQMLIDGLTNDPSWKQKYFWPLWDKDFALAHFIDYEHLAFVQVWVIQGVLTVLLLISIAWLYRKNGRTFLELASTRLDRFITDFVVLGFTGRCQVCGQRAFYRDEDSGEPLCPAHAKIRPNLAVNKVSENTGARSDD